MAKVTPKAFIKPAAFLSRQTGFEFPHRCPCRGSHPPHTASEGALGSAPTPGDLWGPEAAPAGPKSAPNQPPLTPRPPQAGPAHLSAAGAATVARQQAAQAGRTTPASPGGDDETRSHQTQPFRRKKPPRGRLRTVRYPIRRG